MLGLTKAFFAFLAVSAVWLVVSSRNKRRQRAAKAMALGCEEPFIIRKTNLLGNSLLRESIKATREFRGPQFVVEKMNSFAPNCHTFKVPILDYEILITRDPENARTLFSGLDFDVPGTRQASWYPLLGKGIFTSRGEVWKHSRALFRPQFAREMICDVALEEEHVKTLMNQFPADVSTGWTEKVDLSPLFFRFTLDTVSAFIFGRSTNSLQNAENFVGDEDISQHLDSAKKWIELRGTLAKFYWLGDGPEFRKNCSMIHKFVDAIVTDHLAGVNEKPLAADTEEGSRFFILEELAKMTQDPQEIRNETLHVLIAGRDTTASLLCWLIYFLARYPKIYNKLRSSIVDKFGSRRPEYKQLQECRYMQWVIQETIRYVGIIPINDRVAMVDTTLPRGGGVDGTSPIFVPKGTQVLIPLYAMQHRADLWGADVGEFRPERWETYKPGWEYIPFGAGRRKCLGQAFARAEASYVLSRFCQRYDAIENLEEGDNALKFNHSIENRPGSGVQVRLHVAKDSL